MKSTFNSILKLGIIYVLRFIIRIMSVFPIKDNRIIINSYRGQQYSCSPKYLSEWLITHYPGQYEIIWAFKEPSRFMYLKKQGIKLVKFRSLKRFYYEATAKISINNIGSFSWIPLRKGQEHINTWHGAVDYKKVALQEAQNNQLMRKSLLMTANETTLYLSASRFFSEYCLPMEFGYYGNVVEAGLPRNDILLGIDNLVITKKVRMQYGVPEQNILLLYAPTWRYEITNTIPSLDFERIIDAVEKRFERPCSLAYRAHHLNGCTIQNLKHVIDVTGYPDSQEIMAASDIMITDYSSMIWDFSLMGRPCFLFTPDLEDYISQRNFNIPIEKWGFPYCKSNDDLITSILRFNEKAYKKIVEYHHNLIGSYESGHAREQVCQWIYSRCFGSDRKTL